jgi:REP element-mobilizing transposase RayT
MSYVTIPHDDEVVIEQGGYPLAFFITFRCYGTWLHGDSRGSTDPQHNQPGEPLLPGNPAIHQRRSSGLRHPPMRLPNRHQKVVETTIREVCRHRVWELHALNVLADHVHVVVSARCRPELVMNSFKSWPTRRMREAGLVAQDAKVWSRHGSTKYLWTHRDVMDACLYTNEGQERD